MSMSETLPKRLIGSLGAPSFEGLRALGLSAGRDTAPFGTRGRSVPLGVCLRRDRSCDFVTGLWLRWFGRLKAELGGLCICAGGHCSRWVNYHRSTGLLTPIGHIVYNFYHFFLNKNTDGPVNN